MRRRAAFGSRWCAGWATKPSAPADCRGPPCQTPDVRASVCVGGAEAHWQLPASELDDRVWIGGGERTMYELAFALAELGHDVELRGRISRSVFAELAAHTSRHPSVDAVRRRPAADETVLLLEGFVDPLVFGAIALSAARPVLVLLAPAGLMGWSFEQGWTLPDPLRVDPASVNRPSSYQAMAAIGFELWTHSLGIAASVEAAGVPCRWIGQGTPGPPPEPTPSTEKTHDIVIVFGNRWEPLAREVLDGVEASILVTEPGPNADVLRQLSSARLLVHPMRVEGTSRLAIEARLMQTVPIVLWHAFGAGFTIDDGAVTVDSLDGLRQAAVRLLANPAEIDQLARGGWDFARRWRDWPAYCERVAAAFEEPAPRPGASARAAIGESIDAVVAGARDEQVRLRRSFEEIEAHARALEVDRAALHRYIEDDLLVQIRNLTKDGGTG